MVKFHGPVGWLNSGSPGQNLTSASRMEHALKNSNLGIGSEQAKVLHTEKDGH